MRVSHEIRMSLSFIISPDSLEMFACFRKTVARLSYDIRRSFAKILHCKFAKVSRHEVRNTRMKVVRLSHDSRVTVLRNILAQNSHKIFKHV